MQQSDWAGVFPAITTPFRHDGAVDEPSWRRHVAWLLDAGCRGVVALGSLGEGATLWFDEKIRDPEGVPTVTADRVPLVASISGLATGGMCGAGQGGRRLGLRRADGAAALRVPRRLAGNGGALLRGARATPLSCMLYNNPIAYGTDRLRRAGGRAGRRARATCTRSRNRAATCGGVTAVRALLGDRLAFFAGLDDMIVEAVRDRAPTAGWRGW